MAIRIQHPYTDLTAGQWLRGNLHAHTNLSDGTRPQQDVIDDYAARGYDFLMLSDHDIHTGEADYARLKDGGMLLIPGNEISRDGVHLLHVHSDRRILPHPQRQQVLCEIRNARGFAVMAHPNWRQQFDHATIAQLSEWIGYAGMEIYNGLIGDHHGSPYATNKWDMLLSAGRRIWGFANDDSHRPEHVERGWNIAYAAQRTPDAVVEALAAGRFYASTGVTIEWIEVDGQRIRIETKDADRIVALRDVGKRFAVADASVIEVQAPDDAAYVRFECWGRGEQFAWTQPFFIERDDAPPA